MFFTPKLSSARPACTGYRTTRAPSSGSTTPPLPLRWRHGRGGARGPSRHACRRPRARLDARKGLARSEHPAVARCALSCCATLPRADGAAHGHGWCPAAGRAGGGAGSAAAHAAARSACYIYLVFWVCAARRPRRASQTLEPTAPPARRRAGALVAGRTSARSPGRPREHALLTLLASVSAPRSTWPVHVRGRRHKGPVRLTRRPSPAGVQRPPDSRSGLEAATKDSGPGVQRPRRLGARRRALGPPPWPFVPLQGCQGAACEARRPPR